MSQEVDREGDFRGTVTSYGLREMETQAVCVSLVVAIEEHWTGEGWEDWRQYEVFARGDVWLIKKDGSINTTGSESLAKSAGWDGQLTSIVNGSWEPPAIQVRVQRSVYKDRESFRIAFVNSYNSTPGGGATSNVDEDRLKALQAKYGSQFRAIAGNVKRNAPTEKPAAPAKPPGGLSRKQLADKQKAEAAVASANSLDVPF